MSHQGWIKLHRKLKDWEWFQDGPTLRLFIYCLLTANQEAGTWQGVEILPGQFISGRSKISANTGLSEQQIRTAIKRLELAKVLTSKSTSKYTLFSLNSWKSYQGRADANQQVNQPYNQQPNHKQEERRKKKELLSGKPTKPKHDPEYRKTILEALREHWGSVKGSLENKAVTHLCDAKATPFGIWLGYWSWKAYLPDATRTAYVGFAERHYGQFRNWIKSEENKKKAQAVLRAEGQRSPYEERSMTHESNS